MPFFNDYNRSINAKSDASDFEVKRPEVGTEFHRAAAGVPLWPRAERPAHASDAK